MRLIQTILPAALLSSVIAFPVVEVDNTSTTGLADAVPNDQNELMRCLQEMRPLNTGE
jgi:hypothetical protein